MKIEEPDFRKFVAPFVGLPVSHVWRGHGSALFVEFGELHYIRRGKDKMSRNPYGQFGFSIEGSWRIEGKKRIWGGSWSENPRCDRFLSMMVGAAVVSITLFGRLPEVDLELSNGMHLLSFMSDAGDPGWTVADYRGDLSRHLSIKIGRLSVEESSTVQEKLSPPV